MQISELPNGIAPSALMKSGNFARLCQTTKETLRHYREQGLLQPLVQGENSYYYYSPIQLTDYLLIALMSNAGTSLREIRDTMCSSQEGGLEELMRRNAVALSRERELLFRKQRLLENTLIRREECDSWLAQEVDWRVVDVDEECFLQMDLSQAFVSDDLDSNESLAFIGDMIEQIADSLAKGEILEMQSVYRLGLQALRVGKPEEDYALCLRVADAADRPAAYVKRAGRYYQRLRKISLEEMIDPEKSLFDAHRGFLVEVESRGFVPVDDVFEQEFSLYSGDMSKAMYTQLSVRIAE